MYDEERQFAIITIGRQFWHDRDKTGIWAAEMLWTDDDGYPQYGQVKGVERGQNNVALEVKAALEGLKQAVGHELPVEVRSVNESVVQTVNIYMPGWKRNGWRKSDKEPPKSLAEWQEIDALCDLLQVTWTKRSPKEIDQIEDFQRLWHELEQRESEFLMKRALERDPY